MSFNKIIVMGRIGTLNTVDGRDTAITKLSVATDRKGKNGEKMAEWHDIVFFGKTAEIVAKYFEVGRKILVEGEIQTNEYKNKEGVIIKTKSIFGQSFSFVDSMNQSGGADKQSKHVAQVEDLDDDIPF